MTDWDEGQPRSDGPVTAETRPTGVTASLVPIVVGVAVVVGAARLPIGSLTAPGPGLWPVIVGTVTFVCGLVLLITGTGAVGVERFGTRVRVSVWGAVSLCCFVPLFAQLGLILPAIALLVFWLRLLGGESWTLALTVAALAPLSLHVLFVELLGVPLPPDILPLNGG